MTSRARASRSLGLAGCAVALASCVEAPSFRTGAGPGDDTTSSCDEVTEVPDEVVEALHLDTTFYARHCAVFGIDVLGSERVPDAAMLEAGRIIEGVLEGRERLRDAIHDRFFRVVVVASSAGEQLREVPELADLRSSENAAAGIGPVPAFPAASVRDSAIVCRARDRDPLATPPGDTLVHELAHAVLDMGLPETDPGFRVRLERAYRSARDAGLWTLAVPPPVQLLFGELPTENYMMSNPAEYWSTGASAWFGFKPLPLGYGLTDDDPPELQLEALYGRDALTEHDPELAALLEEVFGSSPALRPNCDAWIPTFSR